MRKSVGLAIALAVVLPGGAVAEVPPPDQVSGLVWLDSNKNGAQDDGEPGVPGIKVIIRNDQGQQLSATTTGSDGRYAAAAPGGDFTVCFGLPDGYADYLFVAASLAAGCAAGAPSVDAGIVGPPNALGGTVWVDVNRNGVREDGEPRVPGVTVIVLDGTGRLLGTTTTGADGRYGVNNLPDGTFTVCFGMSTLPDAIADHLVTRPNAGEDDLDSDADQASGCTSPVNLGPGNRQNLTVDAGTVAPGNRIGDFVWLDGNRNGVQDAGEPGVLGVTVRLQAGGADVARTTTNASGRYLFDNMPDGTYRVCFELSTLPAEVAAYRVTEPDVAADDVDSDADRAGCTQSTTVGVGRRADRTLDAGLVAG